ncbi:MAG: hypothetical protein AB8G16_02690 [Gammaproteobacteria bacterium]
MYYLLFYQYVDNILEARTPFRDAHLARLNALVQSGHVVVGAGI